jgi:hypothetical protein
MRHQRGARAHARGYRRGFTAGVPATDHDDIECVCQRRIRLAIELMGGVLSRYARRGKQKPGLAGSALFHVKQTSPHRRVVGVSRETKAAAGSIAEEGNPATTPNFEPSIRLRRARLVAMCNRRQEPPRWKHEFSNRIIYLEQFRFTRNRHARA